MSGLIDLLQQCEVDTRRWLGDAAAARLGHWRLHAESEDQLVQYIKRLLRGPHRENGWRLELKHGLSLERIVLDQCPGPFDEDDYREARQTLGLST
jgi:hypothetical protein